jgi:hypothetical protein
MRGIFLTLLIVLALSFPVLSQVDTTFIYNESTPYGTLDLRISKSPSNYYYLEEGKTFSFRTEGGQRTNSYLHMTAWDSEPYLEGQLREKFATDDNFVMNYRLLLPEGFNPASKYPIVLFLHGIQETGNCVEETCIHGTREYDPNENSPSAPEDADFPLYNNDYNLLHGGRNYLNARNRAGTRRIGDPALDSRAFPGLALFPQSNNGWSPYEVENALKLLRLIIKKYNVDLNRVYINGLSRGGYGSFEAMKRAPWMFAAAALFSPVSDANILALNLAPTIQHIPLWIFQGGQDLLPLPRDTEERIRRYRNAGMSVRYTLYSHLGHATWNEAMEEPDFFSWLLGYKNTRLHAFGGSEAICQSDSEGLQLSLPPGYREYEWQLNQGTIKTGGEHSITVTQSGAYRGRYKFANTGQWNEWSKEINVGFSSPVQASFFQHGTLHLPDLNGKNEAVLEASGDHNHYNWYRYESRLDFPGDSDDTIKIARIDPAVGSGYFSVRVADFASCFSPPSEARKIFFYGTSPVNISAPNALTAESKSPSEVELSWKDNSNDELGFELWRRMVAPGSPSAWVMATITASDVQSYRDTRLRASSKYEYRIRAVSNEGRSEYFPVSSTAVYVETPSDDEPPDSPPSVTGELVDVNTILVQWRPATDHSAITEYHLFVNGNEIRTGDADTTYTLHNLQVNTLYTIQVAAVDEADNLGTKSAPISVSTEMTGLFYKHTTGAWADLKSIDWSIVEYRGRVPDFDLSPKRQEDFFNFRFDGFLLITKPGDYQFRMASNDGSRLTLNDTLLVENDGIHDVTSVTGPLRYLRSGPHRITVDFFDFMNIDSLLVEYSGPDTNNEWIFLSRDILKSSPEAGAQLNFIIFPNPSFDGTANIEIRDGTGDPFTVTVLNSLGQKVIEYHQMETGRSSFEISRLQVPNGIYIVTVTQNGRSNSKRLVSAR